MARSPTRIGRSQRYTAPEFKPYVAALGQLALAWNDLQESLKGIFWTLSMDGPPQEGDFANYAPLHVWAALPSDRQQRDILKALVDNIPPYWGRPKLVEDVNWLLGEARALEQARNDCIHSPLFAVDYSLYGLPGPEKIAPAYWLLNTRAAGLQKRSEILGLLGEFRHTRDRAIVLSDYAQEINLVIARPQRPWPRRPAMPTRQAKKGRQGPQVPGAPPRLPLLPSRA